MKSRISRHFFRDWVEDGATQASRDRRARFEAEADMATKAGFAKRLNQLMHERGMTVREAGQHAGVATSTVQNWRSGHVPTDFVAVRRLAEALGVSFSFLLTGEEERLSKERAPTITECFEEAEVVFDGYARVKIERLVPIRGR